MHDKSDDHDKSGTWTHEWGLLTAVNGLDVLVLVGPGNSDGTVYIFCLGD